MSYTASTTREPTLTSQIGYSYIIPLTTASVSAANTDVSETTIITNIPIGVWMMSSAGIKAEGSTSQIEITAGTVNVTIGGTSIFYGGIYTPNTSVGIIYVTPTGTFYSNGTTSIDVIMTIRAATTTLSTISGSITLTKIA